MTLSLEVLEGDILWPRWVARIGVTRSTEACFLTADRQCTELPLLRLPRLVSEVVGCYRSLFRYVFDVVEQRSTMALFTARADGCSATPAPLDFCKARLWQVMDASIDLRDPNTN